ncbi:hypothetical protein [Nannocystis radixulma]|uniref:Uncharacterized protein n=1 Tax=Nannocystis radixulma TaxID=2995305 RepID=A0ABT5B108_9BACT|nr:hypothetical protein [Nannocystis radixulma]MDC0667789.1 hypothetical protein [Nannocystis radixulma]
MSALQKLGPLIAMVLGLALVSGCYGLHGAAARRTAANPAPSRDSTTSPGCMVALAAEDSTLYWAERGRLLRWDTATASVPTALTSAVHPTNIALDASGIYWIDGPHELSEPRAVHRVGKDGSGPRVLANTTSRAKDLVAAAGRLYWIATEVEGRGSNLLWSLDPRGGQPRAIGVVDDRVWWLAVVDEYAYWVTYDPPNPGGQIRRMALASGELATLASIDDLLAAFVVDAQGMVRLGPEDGVLQTAAADATEWRTLARLERPSSALALAGDRVYVVDGDALLAVSRSDASLARTEFSTMPPVEHIAVADDYVFLASAPIVPHEGCLGTTIRRLAPP